MSDWIDFNFDSNGGSTRNGNEKNGVSDHKRKNAANIMGQVPQP